jgi:hypothetical protein
MELQKLPKATLKKLKTRAGHGFENEEKKNPEFRVKKLTENISLNFLKETIVTMTVY